MNLRWQHFSTLKPRELPLLDSEDTETLSRPDGAGLRGFCRDCRWRSRTLMSSSADSTNATPRTPFESKPEFQHVIRPVHRARHHPSRGTDSLPRGGTGPPLLLLHGCPQTPVMWHKVAPTLAAHFTVVVSDLRGYGDSSKPRGTANHDNYSFRAMAATKST